MRAFLHASVLSALLAACGAGRTEREPSTGRRFDPAPGEADLVAAPRCDAGEIALRGALDGVELDVKIAYEKRAFKEPDATATGGVLAFTLPSDGGELTLSFAAEPKAGAASPVAAALSLRGAATVAVGNCAPERPSTVTFAAYSFPKGAFELDHLHRMISTDECGSREIEGKLVGCFQ